MQNYKKNSTLHKGYNRTMQTSLVDDTANLYQEVDNYGMGDDIQDIPVITKDRERIGQTIENMNSQDIKQQNTQNWQ